MEFITFIILLIVAVPIVLAIWLVIRVVRDREDIQELSRRLGLVQNEVEKLKNAGAAPKVAEPLAEPLTVPKPPPPAVVIKEETIQPPRITIPAATSGVYPITEPVQAKRTTPPPIATPRVDAGATAVPRRINWEQFLGVKGFAYAAGLAFFLGITFAIKYSFDHNLISPALRMGFGFLTGMGLLIGGIWLHRRQQYTVGAQTLCATGVVILYAVTFACHAVYQFHFFGTIPTFLMMALVTVTAFLIAVRLDAMVVAILGMLGGFLTPVLISTGQDSPMGLFGYITILDAGLILVAVNRGWEFLIALGALGTVLLQIGWAARFFESEKYFEGDKIFVALAVLLDFTLLFLAAAWWSRERQKSRKWASGAAFGLSVAAFMFAGWFLQFPTLADRPWLIFGFVFLVDLIVGALVLLDRDSERIQPLAGLAVFGLLGAWSAHSLDIDLLNAALVFYFIFAVFHSAFPLFLQRRNAGSKAGWGCQIFPPIALGLVLIPIFQLPEISFWVWPFVLLVDVLAIAVSVMLVSVLPVLIVIVLTLTATGALIFKIPQELTGLSTSFWLLGGFVVFFVVAGVWAARKFKLLAPAGNPGAGPLNARMLATVLPAFSAALPFLLLIMATLRLPLLNPSPVFGLALLLVVLLFGICVLFKQHVLPAIALGCVVSLECSWHFRWFDSTNAAVSPDLVLAWYLIFTGVFGLFPFLLLRKLGSSVVPWAAAAVAGIPQFLLVHQLIKHSWPNNMMGLLPAAFALPPLLGLFALLKKLPAGPGRTAQLAWFGGVALFFITLIFPIQFDRQWITIGWALEGAALLWLFHRVPHPGLRLAGVILLIAAFARLAGNPAVLGYHPRSAVALWNWYLYAYGIGALCQFAGARLLAPPRNLVMQSNVPPILSSLGTILAFLLLNIEIADFFSPPGSALTFEFRNNFARDMTYSIAWALFALMLLVVGIVKKTPPARYATLGLLCVTLAKLFFHDLSQLGQLYRIGAFIGVAVIAMLASLTYQRFFAAANQQKPAEDKPDESKA